MLLPLEEACSFLKKRTKKLLSLCALRSIQAVTEVEKSLFASFSSEKEGASLLALTHP